MRKKIIPLLILLFSQAALAEDETALYFEDEGDSEPEESYRDEESTSSSVRALRTNEDIGFTGSIGFVGSRGFFGRGGISYPLMKFVYTDFSAFYASEDDHERLSRFYGGDLDLVLKLKNRTVFTPFAGAGPGFEKWAQADDGQMYDDGQSVTASYYFGLIIGFTKNFGMSVARRVKYFVEDAPMQGMDDDENGRGRSIASVDVGFQVMF